LDPVDADLASMLNRGHSKSSQQIHDAAVIEDSKTVSKFLEANARSHAWQIWDISPSVAFAAAEQGWLSPYFLEAFNASISRGYQQLSVWNRTEKSERVLSPSRVWDISQLSVAESANFTFFPHFSFGLLHSYEACLRTGADRFLSSGKHGAHGFRHVTYDADSVFARLVPIADIVWQMAALSAAAAKNKGIMKPKPEPLLPHGFSPGAPKIPELIGPGTRANTSTTLPRFPPK